MNIVASSVRKLIAGLAGLGCVLALGGCQSMVNNMVVNQPALGFNPGPPAIEPILATPAADAELGAYLQLFAALDKDLEGVAGEPMSAPDSRRAFTQMRDLALEFTRQTAPDGGTGSSTAVGLATIEKMLDDMKDSSPRYLAVLPPGLPKQQSLATIYQLRETETLIKRWTTIDMRYPFATREAMIAHATALQARLRTVFGARYGWRFLDKAAHEREVAQLRAMTGGKGAVERDNWAESYDAGMLYVLYMWPSGLQMNLGGMATPAMNQVAINLIPVLQPYEGKYYLIASMSRTRYLPAR